MCAYISTRKRKSVKPEVGETDAHGCRPCGAASSNKDASDLRDDRNRKSLHKIKICTKTDIEN